MKKLLVIGGPRMACNIVKKAQKMGLYVIVADQFLNSPAKKVADEEFLVSIDDVDGLVKLARQQNVDGVITGYIDEVLPYYQKVCRILNLPCYATEEQIKIANNKDLFKKTCMKYHVPVVPEYDIGNIDEKNMKYPVVVKPVDNSGSKGIMVCYDKNDLMIGCRKAMCYSKRGKFIIEKFIDAIEVNAEYHLNDGEITLETIMEKRFNKTGNSCIPLPSVFLYPSTFIKRYKKEVNDLVINMLKELGMKNGTVFMQAFVTDNEILFHEMGFRLGGAMGYKFVEKCCNYSPMELLINFSINGKMCENSIKDKVNPNLYGKTCVELVPTLKIGKIGNIEGMEKIKKIKEVIHVEQRRFKGDCVKEEGSYNQILARILMVGNIEKLVNDIKFINKTLKVIDEQGNDQILNLYGASDLYEWYKKRKEN